jgi:sec-independent protein translocase protein TatC
MSEMSLIEHLEEFRTTLVRCLVILFGGFLLTYALGEYISEFLLHPLREVLGTETGEGKIVYLGLLDKVLSQLQVAFWSSILLTSPLWFREIWRFIKPGLYAHELKVVRPFIFTGFILFMMGGLFGYYIVFPFFFKTLINFGVEGVQASIGLKDYLVLASKVLVFIGIMFQVPNALLILGFMGLVTKQSLRAWRKYVYVGMALASALITPPDVITLMGVWIPLILLYELGVVAVALIVHPYLARRWKE